MKGIQDTTSSTLRQLLGNGLRYNIPKFQRDYSWTTEQWDDLWQDMEAVRGGEEPAHYLGYLVLQTDNDKNYKVIDGQQRMITMSLLILAVIKVLEDLIVQGVEPEKNRVRADSFRSSYIGYVDPVTLVTQNKLSLNRNNDDFYRQRLVPLQRLPQRGINASERLLRNCFSWFYGKLSAQFATGEAIASFLDEMVDKLFFTVITVNDELDAFRVFETLNARGVQLSSADLLKNYLFSVVDAGGSHASEITEMESLWSGVIAKLGNQKFPEFLRMYWNSRNKTVRKNELFKAMRRSVTDRGGAFSLIRDLDQSADTYIALRNPEDELWTGRGQVADNLRDLQLFGVKQPLSLLLAAYENLPADRFARVLRDIVAVSFRYNIIGGLNPNDQERAYNNISLRLRRGEAYDPKMLEPVYPNDSNFETAFANAEFKRTSRDHKLTRYILGKLEKQSHGNPVDFSAPTLSVEHILPENPPETAWQEIEDDTLERCVYRLGNLTLLEASLNRAAGTLPYDDKKKILAKSTVQLTREIPDEHAEWNEASITKRQRKLARVAKAVWQLS